MSDLRFRAFDGPSLLAPFPAVVAEIRAPGPPLAADRASELVRSSLPPAFLARIEMPLATGSFPHLAAALARAASDVNGLQSRAETLDDGTCRIALEALDSQAAEMALRVGLSLASAVFVQAAGGRVDLDDLHAALDRTLGALRSREPDPIMAVLVRIARRRGIPVRPFPPGSRVWSFGEGSASCLLFEAASDRDGMIGVQLAKDKRFANRIVRKLGFPGVTHRKAPTLEAARAIAHELGYPVVVKPMASGKGRGVTADLRNDAELEAAFHTARKAVEGTQILVERHVDGDDHRLTVIGGRLVGVAPHTPKVVGDGSHTVAELIDEVNRERSRGVGPSRIVLDDEIVRLLSRQGLTPDSRPASGVVVRLRTIANLARGGSLADCTAEVHPDNRAMAEAIARGFRLDAIGIDFLTPDVGRSWREGGCAVIEVNGTPGLSSEGRGEIVLGARFPPGTDGRIPSVVLFGLGAAALGEAAAALGAGGRTVGWTDTEHTFSGDEPRCAPDASLGDRVAALVSDPSCQALAVGLTPMDLERHGLPLTRCDLVLAPAGVPFARQVVDLLAACSKRLVYVSGPGAVATEVAALALR